MVGFDLFFLETQGQGRVWDLQVQLTQVLSFLYQLQDLRVKVDVELVGVGVADEERGLHATACRLHGAVPAAVIQHLKLHEHTSHLVVVTDHFLAFVGLKELE